jgi:hypothetical protein
LRGNERQRRSRAEKVSKNDCQDHFSNHARFLPRETEGSAYLFLRKRIGYFRLKDPIRRHQ